MGGAPRARVLRCLLLVMLAACYDEDDDFCDPTVHHYIGLAPLDPVEYQWSVGPTAVGGTQRVRASSYDGCGDRLGVSAVRVQSQAPGVISAMVIDTEEVELGAHANGQATLSFENDLGLATDHIVEARPIAAVTASNAEKGDPQLYYPRGQLEIHLLDDGARALVDHGLSVVGDIPRAADWNELDLSAAAPGDHALGIVAGTSTWDVTVHVVGAIDAIVAEQPMITSTTEYSPDVCFFAELGGQMVGNVPWQFTVDGALHDKSYLPNCVLVMPEQVGTVTVTATALGHTGVATVMVTP